MFRPKLDIFKNTLGEVKVAYGENGEPWFLVNSLGNCLDIKNIHDAFRKLCISDRITPSDRVTVTHKQCKEEGLDEFWDSISSGSNDFREKIFVNEYGMYALVISSDKPEARDFQKWITHTVLPIINHDGGYILGQEKLPEEEQKKISEKVRSLESEVSSLSQKVASLKKDLYKAEKNLENGDDYYGKLSSEIVELLAKATTVKESSPEKYEQISKQAPVIKAVLGQKITFNIRDSLVQFGEKDNPYEIREFPEER